MTSPVLLNDPLVPEVTNPSSTSLFYIFTPENIPSNQGGKVSFSTLVSSVSTNVINQIPIILGGSPLPTSDIGKNGDY